MHRRVPLWAVAGLALALAGLAIAQGYQPNFVRNFLSPIFTGGATSNGDLVVNGDAGVSKNVSIGGTLGAAGKTTLAGVNAGDIVLDGGARLLFNAATTFVSSDGFGGVNGAWGAGANFTGNYSSTGDVNSDGYINPKTGIKNTGTAAACTGTGAVCINDANGLETTDGSGTSVFTVNSAGDVTARSITLSGTTVTAKNDGLLAANTSTLVASGTVVMAEFGAMASAATLTAATFTPGVIGVGAGNFVFKLCSDSACAATTYITCTLACTAAVGTPVACTINTAAVAIAADPFLKITTACATTNPVGNFAGHYTQP